MNTTNKLVIGLAIAAIGLSSAAQAHDADGKRRFGGEHLAGAQRADRGHLAHNWVEDRQHEQRARIRDGWKSGELTHRELHRLREQQERIAKMERRFEADGHLSRHEHKRLDQALDRASRQIFRAKHNDAQRGDWYASVDRHDHYRAGHRH